MNRNITAAALLCGILTARGQNHLRGFGPPQNALMHSISSSARALAGDVNGDGLDDIVLFNHTGNDVHVCMNVTPPGGQDVKFTAPGLWLVDFCTPAEVPLVGDWDGDGMWDLGVVRGHTGDGFRRLFIAHTRRTTSAPVLYFATPEVIYSSTLVYDPLNKWMVRTGDANGDGASDVFLFSRDDFPEVRMLPSSFGMHAAMLYVAMDFCRPGEIPRLADVNGDGRDDLLTFSPANGSVRWMRSAWPAKKYFVTSADETWPEPFAVDAENGDLAMGLFAANPLVFAGDFNGDGRDDIVDFNGGNRSVNVAVSMGTTFSGEVIGGRQWHTEFATGDDAPLVGRFDHDANVDIAMLWQLLPAPAARTGIRVAVAGGHARPAPPNFVLGAGTLGRDAQNQPVAARGARRTLILRTNYLSITNGVLPSAGDISRRFFGTGPNPPALTVSGALRHMSYGHFSLTPATGGGVVGGVFDITVPVNGPVNDWTWLLAQLENRPDFSFATFDSDGDGFIEQHELTIVELNNGIGGTVISGQTFSPVGHPGIVFGNYNTLLLGGSTIATDSLIYTATHEYVHTLGTPDMYLPDGAANLAHSLMGGNPGAMMTHLDPYHRMRVGWLTPRSFDVAAPYCAAAPVSVTGLTTPDIEVPIHLYDSRVNVNRPEHWLFEFRDSANPYDSAVNSAPTVPGATRTRGGVFWHLQTDKFTGESFREQVISPGSNGVLDALPARAGDDEIQTYPGTTPAYISGGVNLVLDTPYNPALDVLMLVPTVMPTNRPWAWPDRGGYNADGIGWKFWSPGDVTLYRRNQTALDRQFRISTSRGDSVQHLQWGDNFQPWLSGVSASASPAGFCPGEILTVRGHMGADIISMHLRTGPTATRSLAQISADGGQFTCRLPADTPSGTHRIMAGSWLLFGPVSNSVLLKVVNPSHDWIRSRGIPGASASAYVDPDGDPDGDGVSNLIEFVLNTAPDKASEALGSVQIIPEAGSVIIRWRQYRAHEAFYTLVPFVSTDLTEWLGLSSASTSAPLDEWQNWKAVHAAQPGRLFVRFRAVRTF